MPDALILNADCFDAFATFPDASIDAIVTDPPYGLGFMGKMWDELPPGLPWAQECLRVLKPGGHLLAFGGTRTWHRLACAVEDAGFEMRDSIAWLYGSGFPKSLDVSKAIDKRGGNPGLAAQVGTAIKAARLARGWTTGQADQYFCGGSTNWTWYEGRKGECHPPSPATFARIVAEWPELAGLAEQVAEAEREVTGKGTAGLGGGSNRAAHEGGFKTEYDLTAPATEAAQQWQGWGTALKPAFEPIVVARKPLVGTVAANVFLHGTGALNIDGCRIGGEPAFTARRGGMSSGGLMNDTEGERVTSGGAGRWPANVVLDEDQAAALDEQSGIRPDFSSQNDQGGTKAGEGWGHIGVTVEGRREGYNDVGGASRFFYVAKAPKRERPVVDGVAHPTVKPLALMRWLVRLVTPPGGLVLDPFAGSGTTVEAALLEGFDVIGVEREADYQPLIAARVARAKAAL